MYCKYESNITNIKFKLCAPSIADDYLERVVCETGKISDLAKNHQTCSTNRLGMLDPSACHHNTVQYIVLRTALLVISERI